MRTLSKTGRIETVSAADRLVPHFNGPRPGIRYFKCDDCGHEWLEPSRDVSSPSGDDCKECGVWCGARPASTEEFDRLWKWTK